MNFVGLPVPVSTRHRIVIDRTIRETCCISRDCQVQLVAEPGKLRVFPMTSMIEGAIVKMVTIGRLNLPVSWAAENGVSIGSSVYLARTADCMLVLPGPVHPDAGLSLLGFPTRRYGKRCYLPVEYLRHYNLPVKQGLVAMEQVGNALLVHALPTSGSEQTAEIYQRHLRLPKAWLLNYNRAMCKTMYANGTEQGLRISFEEQV